MGSIPAIVDKWGHAVVLRLVVVFPLVILALVTAFAYPPRGGARSGARAVLGLLVPLVIGALVSVWHELSLTRYLLFVSPFLALLLAAGSSGGRGGLAASSSVMVWAGSVRRVAIPDDHASDSDFRPAALVADSRRAGDAVIVQPPEAGVQLAYYLRDRRYRCGGCARNHARQRAAAHARQAYVAGTRLSLQVVRHTADSLDKALPGAVVRDSGIGSGERRVRMIEVRMRARVQRHGDCRTPPPPAATRAPLVNVVGHEFGCRSGPPMAHRVRAVGVAIAALYPGNYFEDPGIHFLRARWMWTHPWMAVDAWDRPLFTAVYSLPANLPLSGFSTYLAAKLTTVVISLVTAWLTFKLARAYGLERPALVIPLLWLQPCVFCCRARRRRSRCSCCSWCSRSGCAGKGGWWPG